MAPQPMPLYHPPRREPRVLAIQVSGDTLAWAVADPFMVRGAGLAPAKSRSRAATLQRLVRREKPTLLLANGGALGLLAARVGKRIGVPVTTARLPRLSRSIARDLYPELQALAPGRLEPLAISAIAAVLYADTPPRQYAACRNREIPRPS